MKSTSRSRGKLRVIQPQVLEIDENLFDETEK